MNPVAAKDEDAHRFGGGKRARPAPATGKPRIQSAAGGGRSSSGSHVSSFMRNSLGVEGGESPMYARPDEMR